MGSELAQRALCLGGAVCTASDCAVLLGRMRLGSRQAVAAAGLSEAEAQQAWEAMQGTLEACLDRVKTEAGRGLLGVCLCACC